MTSLGEDGMTGLGVSGLTMTGPGVSGLPLTGLGVSGLIALHRP
jgi:hypothetical protein